MPAGELRLAPLPTAIRTARGYTRTLLKRWLVDGEPQDAAELVVSELTTNALRYGCPPEGWVVLTIRRLADRLRIEVADTSAAEPIIRAADDEMEGGRGLALVEAMTLRWGYYHRDGNAKVVWAEVELKPNEAPAR
jgi:anti-sigma regulatory factor (Ser/Thr protein kinase)